MLIPREARLAPAPRIEPEPVDKGGTDKSLVYVKWKNLSKKLATLRGVNKITYKLLTN